MKTFLAMFAAVLLAGLILWGLISHQAEATARRERLEKITLRTVDATKQLAAFALAQKPEDMAQAEAGIRNLRELAANETLSTETRNQAKWAADDYEEALKRWR